MIRFVFWGEAVGKGRPRVSRRGGYVHTYTPEKTRTFEKSLQFEFMAQTCDEKYPRDKALYAEIVIGVGVPKSFSKKKSEQCLSGDILPSKKPDIDNICKAVLDALNGYAYDDDAQVVQITAMKRYATEPYVEVVIGEIGEV